MHRPLIFAAVAAVSLALGAVVAIAVMNATREPHPPPPGPPAPTVAEVPAEEAEVEMPMPLPTPRPSRRVTVRPGQEVGKAAGEAAAAEGAAGETETGGVTEDRGAEMRQLLESMSDDDRRALIREFFRMQGQQRMEQRRYEMPSDRRLRRLERTRDENLRLTDAQQQQISSIRESYKPQLDTLLGDIWVKQADLREQAMEIMQSGGSREDAQGIWDQVRQLGEQADQIKAPLEAEYQTAVSSLLTPAQLEVFQQENTDRGGRGDRRRPGGGFDFGGRRGGGDRGGNPGAGG